MTGRPSHETAKSARSAQQRQSLILASLESNGRVDVGDLSGSLDVAEETIRRDLRALEDRGLIQRAHGGAIRGSILANDLNRITGADVGPDPIAQAALSLVPASGSIFIDAGDIAESLARLLPDSSALQVVTNSVPVALAASRKPNVDVYNLGGAIDPADGSQSGQWTRNELERVRVDVAFIAAEGLTADGWLTASSPKVATIKRGAVDAASRVVLLMPAGQLEPTGLVKYAHLTDFSAVVCDERTSEALQGAAAEAGIEVIVASPHKESVAPRVRAVGGDS